MSTARPRRVLRLAVMAIALFVARRAASAIDVTGQWYLAFDSQQGLIGLVQTGGTLQASSGSWAVNFGTIDSATGAFTLNLADLSLLSCGTFTGTVSIDSRTLSGTARLFSTDDTPGCSPLNPICICKVETDFPLWGSRAPCGNGVIDPGETCDDGHVAPGDCCGLGCTLDPAGTTCADDGNVCTDEACDGSGTCVHTDNTAPCGDPTCGPGGVCAGGVCTSSQPAPAGTPCDRDADACTADACDGTGSCAPGAPLECGPCETCESPVGCRPYVRPYCGSVLSGDGRKRLDLRKGSTTGGDRALFAWSDTVHSDPSVFGDPTQSTDYEMCVFQPPAAPGAGATPFAALAIPAAGTCDGRPCWSAVRNGFRLRNGAARRSGGASSVTLRASDTSGMSITVRGDGAPLGLPASLDAPELLAQVVAKSGTADLACWEWTFTTPTRRAATRFSARR